MRSQIPGNWLEQVDRSETGLERMGLIRVSPSPVTESKAIRISWRRCPPWCVSFGLHVFLVAVLAILSLPFDQESGRRIHAAFVVDEHIHHEDTVAGQSAASSLEFSAAADPRPLRSDRVDIESQLKVSAPKTAATSVMHGPGRDAHAGSSFDHLRHLVDGPPTHVTPQVSVRGSTDFFGIHAKGDEFVFVVDSSRSMMWRRWNRACRELTRSIEQLGKDQKFCVLFFDAETHLMFRQAPDELKLIAATPQNCTRLKRWISSIEFGSDTKPFAAVQFAMALRPDAVFLLSDGEFQDETLGLLRQRATSRHGAKTADTVIHTIGFASQAGQRTLKAIAEENGGTYRFVP